jgi:hypothetical protein
MKQFNITGVCIENKHYMVDIGNKINKIINMIENDKYFTINRARQYGKTTTFFKIYNVLKNKYLVIKISFEGLGENTFSSECNFIIMIKKLISKRLKQNKIQNKIIDEWDKNNDNISFEDFSTDITNLLINTNKEIVLLIDEVDKSSNNQLFLHFLGMLRNKYLDRAEGFDKTFKSVILAGVYDVKNLKLKLLPNDEKKYNSPWNIASDFDVDMDFNTTEISSMLIDYKKEQNIDFDIDKISNLIYKFTCGYPYLVSKLCKVIHEKLNQMWTEEGIKLSIKILLDEKDILFDDLIKNLENNNEIYNIVYNLIINNESIQFNIDVHEIGVILGIFKNVNGRLTIHNKIYEIRIYNYMIAKKYLDDIGGKITNYSSVGLYENIDGTLDIENALKKYQEYMSSVYNSFDSDFIERQGRLLLLAFFKPIINGKGFYFVESQTGFEQRQDIVITYGETKYIIELKIWRGKKYHNDGIVQLKNYLELENVDKGFLIIYDKNKKKVYKNEDIHIDNKKIFAIWC